MKQWILWLIFILAFFFEGTITTLSLVLISFLILMIFLKKKSLFYLALITGVILDIFLLRPLGITSLMLVIFLFLIHLYEKKFETSTNYFVLLFSFFGSLIYLFVLGIGNAFFQSVFNAILALILIKFLMHSEIKKPKYKMAK